MDHLPVVLSVVLFLVRCIAALRPSASGTYWQRKTEITKHTTRSFLTGTVQTTKSVARTVTVTRKNFP